MTKRRAILQVVLDRLATVRRTNEFSSNLGRQVYLGEIPELTPDDDEEAVAVVVGDDQVKWQQEKKYIELRFEIVAVVNLSARTVEKKQAWMRVECLLEDIKTAIEAETDPGRTMDGLLTGKLNFGTTRVLPREAGSMVVGVGIVYSAPYTESWGRP